MGLYDKKLWEKIGSSIANPIVDNRPYRLETGLFPDKRTERWVLGEKQTKNSGSQLFIKEGVYEDVIKEAKEWAKSRGAEKLYLLYLPEAEDDEKARYDALCKRYEGEGKPLSDAELEEFKKLHRKYA